MPARCVTTHHLLNLLENAHFFIPNTTAATVLNAGIPRRRVTSRLLLHLRHFLLIPTLIPLLPTHLPSLYQTLRRYKGLNYAHTLMPLLPLFTNHPKFFCFDSISYCLLHGGTKDLTTQTSRALRPLLHTHTLMPLPKNNQKHVSTQFRAAFFTVAQRA
jgi:hypothetical protein